MIWHILLDEKGERPLREQIVIGYWISGSEKFACLCYYDWRTNEWFSADNDESIKQPDYWINTP